MHASLNYLKHAAIAAISFIIAIIDTINHTIIAPPYAYMSTVWAGTENPFWPHLVLVPLSAIAGIAVGAGIVLERPKYSAAVHRVAFWFVVVGVAVESLCTIALFCVDERISGAQQSKIIALESARRLNPESAQRVIEKLKPYAGTKFASLVMPDSECLNLLTQIEEILPKAGWVETDRKFADRLQITTKTAHKVDIAFGAFEVFALIGAGPPAESLAPAARELAAALNEESIAAGFSNDLPRLRPTDDVVTIVIGSKPMR